MSAMTSPSPIRWRWAAIRRSATGVIFGGLAAVQQFCRVGKGAMVGGLTGVNRDVIPYAMAFGDHVELAGLNLIGLKRRGLSRDAINALRGAFRAIFYGNGRRFDRDAGPRGAGALAGRGGSGRDRRFHPGRRQTAALPGAPPRRDRAVSTPDGVGHHRRRRRSAPRRGRRARAGGGPRGALWCRWSGSADEDWVEDFPHEWLSLGEPGRIIKALSGGGRQRRAAGGAGGPAEIFRDQARCQGPDDAAQADRGGPQGRRRAAALDRRHFCAGRGFARRQRGRGRAGAGGGRGRAGQASQPDADQQGRHRAGLRASCVRWARWMSARRRWSATGWRWRSKRPKAPTP